MAPFASPPRARRCFRQHRAIHHPNRAVPNNHHRQAMSAAPPPNKELPEVREMQAAARSGRVRQVAAVLPEGAVRMRKDFFADKVRLCLSQLLLQS